MKKLALVVVVVLAACFGVSRTPAFRQLVGTPSAASTAAAPSEVPTALAAAIRDQQNGIQVTGEGRVSKLLTDDNDGARHQRFILTLASGQTLLIAHNIDIAPRIASLKIGDSISFHGVYEWNSKGGVIHWTHHDPGGRHEAGWLKHAGKIYQ